MGFLDGRRRLSAGAELAMGLVGAAGLLHGIRSRVVEVGGQRIHALERRGPRGPTLLFVHGLGGSALGWWWLLPRISGASRLVAPDLPGSGFSPLPGGGPLDLDGSYAVLRAFAHSLGEPLVVVGNSLGGALALKLAADEPSLVRGTVLVAPAGAPFAADELAEVARLFSVRTSADARALLKRLYHRPPTLLPLIAGPQLRQVFTRPSVRRIVEELERAPRSLTPEELAGLKWPGLLIWGGAEKVLPPSGLAFLDRHLPQSFERMTVPHFGHCPQLEHPAELAAHLDAFLARMGAAQAPGKT